MTRSCLVTGGAGFIGSHLCERLVDEGHRVLAVDNLITGSRSTLEQVAEDPRFEFLERDLSEPLFLEHRDIDRIYHLASPASPKDYRNLPIHTLKVGALGTYHMLGLAREHDSSLLLASTSEVYGDPEVHPQPEWYTGNVDPVGPRSVYDEAKRYGEAITTAYHEQHGIDTRIARIFNTYGPRMRKDDGRVIPTFIRQALNGEPLTVYGDGTQTRSFCYVTDMVDGLLTLMQVGDETPTNLGNPRELSIGSLAEIVLDLSGSSSGIVHEPLPEDDPSRRCPDISRARQDLGWTPRVGLEEGLERTIQSFSTLAGSQDKSETLTARTR